MIPFYCIFPRKTNLYSFSDKELVSPEALASAKEISAAIGDEPDSVRHCQIQIKQLEGEISDADFTLQYLYNKRIEAIKSLSKARERLDSLNERLDASER